MQRFLFITALLVTAGLGAFVVAGPVSVLEAHDSRTDHKKSDCRTKGDIFRENHRNVFPNCKVTPTPIPSTSTSAPTTPKPSDSTPAPEDDEGGTPTGEKLIVAQTNWNTKGTTAGVASSMSDSKWCASGNKPATPVKLWNNYLDMKGLRIKDTKYIIPSSNGSPDNHYVISSVFSSGGDTAKWESLFMSYKYMSGTIRVAYRVSDSPTAVTDPKDSSWITLAIPRPSNQTSCKIQFGGAAKAFVSTYALNKEGKYFQYKIGINGNIIGGLTGRQIVDWVRFNVQPIGDGSGNDGGDGGDGGTDASPSPTASATPTSTGTPTPSGKTGKITIVTKKIIPDTSTPSPAVTVSPVVSPKPVNICLENRDTEPAPAVGLAVEQTAGGETLIEDQETDDTGTWRGMAGEVDEFEPGTYKIELGDFQDDAYKLVAICVTPDSNKHYLKTQTDPNTGHATIFVVAGLETKVTALYAPRTKPYLTLSTFALDGADLTIAGSDTSTPVPSPQPNTVSTTTATGRKVLRIVYPGQKILYYIKWQNTGEAVAKNVFVQDVIPNEFKITDDIEERYGITLTVKGEQRTISKQVGDVPKGGQGSIMFAVTLPDNFGDNAAGITNGLGGTSLE